VTPTRIPGRPLPRVLDRHHRRHPVRAVIFDMDGVIADTEPLHLRAMRRFVAPGTLTDAQYEALVGTGVEPTMRWIKDTYERPESTAELRAMYSDLINEELRGDGVHALPGTRELIDSVRERGLELAVASQSSPRWVETTLRKCGLRHLFPHVVTADHVPRPKPAPDIYLRVADRLGVPAEDCLAIEDSAPGVASAHRAGMVVVQSRQTRHAAPPQPLAHAVIASLREFDPRWLGPNRLA
jgi:HAD superfamily hydrolase (TIGR01509 family)